MWSILIIVAIIAIVCVPLVLVHFASQRSWKLKKLTPEEIAKQKQGEVKGWRLLGYIMVLGSLGISFLGRDEFVGFPLWPRIIIGAIGAVVIYATLRDNNPDKV